MARKAKRQSSCSGCMTLLAVAFLALFLREQFHLRWWVAILAAVVGPAVVYAVFATLRETLQKRKPASRDEGLVHEGPPRTWKTIAEHQLQHAAELLNDGYPLAQVSKDETRSTCPVCSRLEGRLVDLTPAREFSRIAIPLEDLVRTGIWHDDCVHRLEYVSPTEYPKGLWRAHKDRIGEPGAFGSLSTADVRRLAKEAALAQRRAEARFRRQAVSALGGVFECHACGKLKPIRHLAVVDGYLNFLPEDLDFVCKDCVASARAQGKYYARHPLPDSEP